MEEKVVPLDFGIKGSFPLLTLDDDDDDEFKTTNDGGKFCVKLFLCFSQFKFPEDEGWLESTSPPNHAPIEAASGFLVHYYALT